MRPVYLFVSLGILSVLLSGCATRSSQSRVCNTCNSYANVVQKMDVKKMSCGMLDSQLSLSYTAAIALNLSLSFKSESFARKKESYRRSLAFWKAKHREQYTEFYSRCPGKPKKLQESMKKLPDKKGVFK